METKPEIKIKKRTLPAWMTAAHNQRKQIKRSEDNDNTVLLQGTLNKVLDNSSKDDAGDKCEAQAIKSASEIIRDAMPFVKAPGSVTYTFQSADCACICEEIMSTLVEERTVPVGFDMEWPVTYKRSGSDKTALIQMCFTDEKCYLFQVCGMRPFPKQLSKLICHEKILLVGLNIESDLWKLERDFDIRVKALMDRGSVIDIGKLANKYLKSSERWDLNGLCKNVLGMRLNKNSGIRCGNWTDIPLNQDQISYSSSDAYAGLLVYQKLHES